MNALLELRKPFESRVGTAAGGPARIPTGTHVEAGKLLALSGELSKLLECWPQDSLTGDGMLIEAHYRGIVAKSNRMTRLLRPAPDIPVNRSVAGARFDHAGDGSPRHVITHFVPQETVSQTITLLRRYAAYMHDSPQFNGSITSTALDAFNRGKQELPDGMYKTEFAQIVKDSYYVQSFTIPEGLHHATTGTFITLFDTGRITVKKLMDHLDIAQTDYQIVDNLTFIANTETVIDRIRRATPYLVSMSAALDDFSQEPLFRPTVFRQQAPLIPPPVNEPTVGVLDTGFCNSSYCSDWVTQENCLHGLDMSIADMVHGTEVSSIIVDGPSLNPWLDDGCGRFRVRHFTIARAGANSALTILENIERIVTNNLDIKVWNLSLGTDTEVSENYISPIAALLDRLQYTYDVIFIVAGTNLPADALPHTSMRIGSPADSINSIVVNACNAAEAPASYSRQGPVLEFFHKPDIAYYGGDRDLRIRVCTPQGITEDDGTSLAAPWITRKIAYLIHVMGFPRQTAKALLIDSASTWRSANDTDWKNSGFGIPPIHIGDMLEAPNNEIRFTVSGVSRQYETYQFQLPIPIDNKGRHPFMARATLCYFPQCDRHQGVDYTKTELDLHFGRLKPPSEAKLRKNPNAKATIEPVNGNMQSTARQINLPEHVVRPLYRKWDNVKHISDVEKSRFAARKTYTSQGFWGISVLAKERWESKRGEQPHPLPFSMVVTLREMEGRNRIEDFKQQCMTWGWTVNAVTVENRIDVYNEGEQEIDFE